MNPWLEHELHALKKWWPNHVCSSNWILLKDYVIPLGWSRKKADVAFRIPDLPGERPYGFWVKGGLLLSHRAEVNITDYVFPEGSPPFDGKWGKFSWELNPWQPGNLPGEGTGIINFVQSFSNRLKELN